MNPVITLRKIIGNSADELAALQSVLDGARGYNLNTTGKAEAESNAAVEMLSALPDNFSIQMKFNFFIESQGQPVGCIDVLRGYPSLHIAWIGLLLLTDAEQNKGLGKQAFLLLLHEIKKWPEISKIKIGVVQSNSLVEPFWKKMGFHTTGERKPYTNGSVISETVLLERDL